MTRLFHVTRIAGVAAFLAVLIALAVTRLPLLGAGGHSGTPAIPAAMVAAHAIEALDAADPPAVPAPAKLIAWGPAPTLVLGAVAAPTIAGEAGIVIDEASGITLYEKDAHTRLPQASLTKIMTALVALERGRASDVVEVNIDSRTMRGSTVMGLVPGEKLTLEDLLYGLMLPSGNDAALAIAEHISGSTQAFVTVMNQRAAELGLINTHFGNPHGLDSGGNYSSAFDLAVLTRVAMQREDFRTIANTKYRVAKGSIATYQLGTLNPLYGRVAGVDGVKTGYTRTARQTLVGSVVRDGHRVFVVILKSPDRATDGTALFNWAFQSHSWTPPSAVAADTPMSPGPGRS